MLREAQSKAVTPTREEVEEVLGIGAEYCEAPDRETRVEVAEAAGPLLASPPVKRPGMRVGRGVALGLLSMWFACSGLSACSGSNPRDQRYGQDAGADFDAPAGTGGAAGAAGGSSGTAGVTGSSTGGAAGATASGGAGGDANGGAPGNGGAAGNGGSGAAAGQTGGNGGTAGQAGVQGANGGSVGIGGSAGATVTLQNDWTAGPPATKMLLGHVS